MRRAIVGAAAAFLAWGGTLAVGNEAAAVECGAEYRVRAGDTLWDIASVAFGQPSDWTRIHNFNFDVLGPNPHLIRIGDRLYIPCPREATAGGAGSGAAVGSEPPVAQTPPPPAEGAEVQLLTGDDYAPFTDRDGLRGGMITDIVSEAMRAAPGLDSFGIDWVNAWDAHLDPLLKDGKYDIGFPWLQPNCAQTPENPRCEFLFSEPMFEMLVLLFVRADAKFKFDEDADIHGKVLCRPAGYYTHDLERPGREWLQRGLVVIEQPRTVADCFDLLVDGEVDAVALNEFTGKRAIADGDLIESVRVLSERPLSIEGLHAIVHSDHPDAEALIAAFDAGLKRIRENGTFNRVLEDHLLTIYDSY